MNKTALFIVIVLIVIVAGALIIKNGNNSAPTYSNNSPTASATTSASMTTNSPSGTTANQFTVTYTDNGFSPSTITIPNGATVQFKNNSSNAFWVASNPHPTHTDYPGFDAKQNIPSASTYSFTFTKPGSWGYHNHLNPSDGGTVIVQ